MAVVVKTALGSNFGVGEFTTHFRTDFSGWIRIFTGPEIDRFLRETTCLVEGNSRPPIV